MRLIASISPLLVAVLVRYSSAAAIDADLIARDPALPNLSDIQNINPGNLINGAINGIEDHIPQGWTPTNLGPLGLIPNSQNCPTIIQKTNWDKYLGVAPIAAAINKACSWQGIMTDLWDGIKCGGKCLLAFIEEDINILQDAKCAGCIGQVVMETLPCINAAGGFAGLCSKATAIPGFGPCLTGTIDTPGICPKGPAMRAPPKAS
ncbi:MAG: hypothetical protein M1830_005962 [Pleopsidium flavum]|nr:MAG: hypothetical protein M1830_005962 [Pleopsidium flavum]